jgi:hypothetical protein
VEARNLRDEGQYGKAMHKYRQCLGLAIMAEDNEHIVICHHEIGLSLSLKEEWEQAEAQYVIALQEAKTRSQTVLYGNILRDFGILRMNTGNSVSAVILLQESFAVLSQTDDQMSLGVTIGKLARAQLKQALDETDIQKRISLIFIAQITLHNGIAHIKERVYFKANLLRQLIELLMIEEMEVSTLTFSILEEIEMAERKRFVTEWLKLLRLMFNQICALLTLGVHAIRRLLTK